MPDPPELVSKILSSLDPASSEQLLPLVYDELRNLARAHMAREKAGHTLQPTALVHEAFLRLGGGQDVQWSGRRHFFCAAAEAMRRILIDQARRRGQLRHGGAVKRVPLEESEPVFEAPGPDLLRVDEALQKLESADPRARQVVNLRYFAGLTTEETADAMGVSVSTIEREWRFLRTFLQKTLGEGEEA